MRYAHLSPDATSRFAELTGNPRWNVYVHIDPADTRNSYFLIPYPDKILQVSFAELDFDPLRFSSAVEALYRKIYEE